jgi:hypothetical protein
VNRTKLYGYNANKHLMGQAQMKSLNDRQHRVSQIAGSGELCSDFANQRLREFCNWADTSNQVAMLKRCAHVRYSVAHIQAERDTTSGEMSMKCRNHSAHYRAKFAAAARRAHQVASKR